MAGDLINGEIPDHWEFTTLGDVCQRGGGNIQTGPFGSQLHASDYVPVGVPSIMPTNIGDNRIVEDGIARITEADANRLGQHRLRAGDIVYSRRGDVEKRSLIREREEGWLCGTGCLKVRLGSGVVDPLFASLFLGHPAIKEWIVRHAVGATMPNLNTSIMSVVPFALPPLAEQKAIAAVLGALDDKIELNRRMNATLEAMARALFQSWFVDFDPVRAKLDGRAPAGMDDTTAALFPDRLEDSPLGHIPKGWAAGTIVEGFNLRMGQSPPGDTYNEEGNGLPFYQGRTDFGFRFPTRRIYCSAATRYAKPGDTLVSVRAPVGDINMANEECCIGRGVAAVRHKSGATSFTYHSMANLYPDFARFEAEGTVFGSINKNSFEKLRFVIPPDEIVAAYERQAGPLDEQIRTLEEQSRTLAALRDTLLPQLLSGEVRVTHMQP
ncbi:MAG TPA: restriction endonuclease subunit S [Thermoflexales bacterium]|nr:restriction endonuclease subunit S [Thermoflexales bacterium]